MRLYTDELELRIRVSSLRAAIRSNGGQLTDMVTLDSGSSEVVVQLVRVVGVGAVRITTSLECPHCGRVVRVLGLKGRWGCRHCLGWRSRSRAQKLRAGLAVLR